MAVLPSPDAVGPIEDSPLRRMGIGSWNPGIIGQATERAGAQFDRLGSEVGALGSDMERQNDSLQHAQAMGAAQAAIVQAHAALPSITDSSQVTQGSDGQPSPVGQNLGAQIANARSMISNPRTAALFDATMQPAIARFNAAATERGQTINNQNAVASFETNTNSIISNAATIDDDGKSAAALEGINAQLRPLVASGAINPEQAVVRRQQAADQYWGARYNYLVGQAEQTRDYSRLERFLGTNMAQWGPNAAGAVMPGQARNPLGPNNVYQNIPDVDDQGKSGQQAKFLQWNPDPVGLSNQKLSEVHPDLQAIVKRAQADNPNLPFVVALGKSTPQQEEQAKGWGWSQSGALSDHTKGLVVDLWPLDGQGHVTFDKSKQEQINAAMQKAAGELGQSVRWGGLKSEGGANQNFRDAPNFELNNPRALTPAEQAQEDAAFQRGQQLTQPVSFQSSGVNVPAQYAPMVQASASKWGVNPTLLTRQLQQENGFRPTGTSKAGAQGIAQFIPSTAARYGVNVNDPQSSIDGAGHYMHDLLGMFGGNQGLALAGYNWGEANVQKWLRNGADPTRAPRETKDYVQSITGHPLSEWVNNPGVPIHTAPLGPGQRAEPPANWPQINPQPFSPTEVASLSPGVGLPVAPLPPVAPTIGAASPAGGPWAADSVGNPVATDANGVAHPEYTSGAGPGGASSPVFVGGRPVLPPPPAGSIASMMPPAQRAQMQLRGINEIRRMQREDALASQRDTRGDIAAINNATKDMVSGVPVSDQTWESYRSAYAKGPPEVSQQFATADAIRSHLQRYAGSSPAAVAADIANLQSEYAAQINAPGGGALVGGTLAQVIKASQDYLHAYQQGVAKDPLGRAAVEGVIGANGALKPLDPNSPTFGQDVADRVTQARTAAALFGMNAPTYLRPEERVALRKVAQQGGDTMVNLAKGIVQGGGSDAYAIFNQIGKDAPPLAQIGQWALDPNVDHTMQINRYASVIAAMADPQARKNLPIVSDGTERAAMLGKADTLGDSYARFSPDDTARVGNTAHILATEAANENHLDPKNTADVGSFPDIIKDAYNEAVGGTKRNGTWYGGIAKVNTPGWFGGTPYSVLVPTNMRQDQFASVVGQLNDKDVAAMGPPPYFSGDNSHPGGTISAERIKQGEFQAVKNAATGMFNGQYRVLLPDPKSGEMQPVLNANGQPWVFDMNRIEPRMRQVLPDAFLPSVGAPSAPAIPRGVPRGQQGAPGRYQDVKGIPLSPDVASADTGATIPSSEE